MSLCWGSMSQTARTANTAPVRNSAGHICIWQCKPVLHYEQQQSYNMSHSLTVGDILNKLKFNKTTRSMIVDYKK